MRYSAKVIMIVDDEEDFTFFLKAGLEQKGVYKVIVVNKGREAFRLARRYLPDVIVLDINMPGVGGFDVLESLKRDDRTAVIPVIMLSARADQDSKVNAARLYTEDFIGKPVELSQLTYSIEKVISRSWQAAGGAA